MSDSMFHGNPIGHGVPDSVCPKCAEHGDEIVKLNNLLNVIQNDYDDLLKKCAEKDAEIARLAESLRHTSADCFRIQKEKDAEIAGFKGATKAWSLLAKDNDELKAKLEKAKEALKTIRDALRDNERMPHIVAKEALKEIGE